MKNLTNQAQISVVALAIGLWILTLSVDVPAFPTTGKDNKTTVNEEILEEFSFVEISKEIFLVDDRPEKIMFFDGSNELVYETEDIGDIKLQVEVLLRKSDLLLEFDGVKYYRVNE